MAWLICSSTSKRRGYRWPERSSRLFTMRRVWKTERVDWDLIYDMPKTSCPRSFSSRSVTMFKSSVLDANRSLKLAYLNWKTRDTAALAGRARDFQALILLTIFEMISGMPAPTDSFYLRQATLFISKAH